MRCETPPASCHHPARPRRAPGESGGSGAGTNARYSPALPGSCATKRPARCSERGTKEPLVKDVAPSFHRLPVDASTLSQAANCRDPWPFLATQVARRRSGHLPGVSCRVAGGAAELPEARRNAGQGAHGVDRQGAEAAGHARVVAAAAFCDAPGVARRFRRTRRTPSRTRRPSSAGNCTGTTRTSGTHCSGGTWGPSPGTRKSS